MRNAPSAQGASWPIPKAQRTVRRDSRVGSSVDGGGSEGDHVAVSLVDDIVDGDKLYKGRPVG
jgi:hypothetical protein